ncbi:hypothetical protein G7085_06915 [Tessaracoccus sp. HDW20]|uniref:hypothetical protein n=1 Tax=Tessaracoccus coleopterorum TaxID=2714950 RepID=UPI0018D2A033|nr:hypothetical protein [Tessaracoccus coleopterorum]NHB84427.1 hypothetical protein [Tessaracoccus coleopterorum]
MAEVAPTGRQHSSSPQVWSRMALCAARKTTSPSGSPTGSKISRPAPVSSCSATMRRPSSTAVVKQNRERGSGGVSPSVQTLTQARALRPSCSA